MRKKAFIGTCLCSLIAITLGVGFYAAQSEPSIRVGMSDADVTRILGEPDVTVGYVTSGKENSSRVFPREKHYPRPPDLMGNGRVIVVEFDFEERVIGRHVKVIRSSPLYKYLPALREGS